MYKALTIVLLLASNILAQTGLDYNAEQSTFLTADTAKIYKTENGVSIRVVGLKTKTSKGLTLTISNLSDPEVEVTTLVEFQGITVGIYPPKNLLPNDDGEYIILGSPGDRFGVRGRTEEGVSQVFVQIDGTPTPVDPPDDPLPIEGGPSKEDLQAVTDISKKAVTNLQDPITAKYLGESLSALSLSEVLPEATKQVQEAITKALLDSMAELDPPYKDWKGQFRAPINNKIVQLESSGKVSTSAHLSEIVKAMASGLKQTASASQNGLITMLTGPNCPACNQWDREVRPALIRSGWTIEKQLTDGVTPSFIIHDKGLNILHTGYMSVSKLKELLDDN